MIKYRVGRAFKRPRYEEEPPRGAGRYSKLNKFHEHLHIVSDIDIERARQCYKDFVRSVSNSSFRKAWNDNGREVFLNRIDRLQNHKDMCHELEAFKTLLRHNKTPGGIQWEKQYWIWMTNSEKIQNHTVTPFVICLKFMQEHMLSQSMEWNEERKNMWLKSCDDLIEPLDYLSFCDDMYLNTNELFTKFGFASHQIYDRTIIGVIGNINNAVKELEKDNKSWSEIVVGTVSFIAGFFNGVFASAVQLTTDLATQILKYQKIWDKELYQKVQGELEKISGVTMALTELLQHYRSAANAVWRELPCQSDGCLAYSKKLDRLKCEHCTKVPGDFTVQRLKALLTLMKPDLFTELLKEARTSVGKTLVSKGLGQLTKISFKDDTLQDLESLKTIAVNVRGIRDMIHSEQEVNVLAIQFRNIAINLKDLRNIIFACYDFPKEEHHREMDSAGKRYQK